MTGFSSLQLKTSWLILKGDVDTRTNSPDSETRSLSLTAGSDRAQEGTTAGYSRECCPSPALLGQGKWPCWDRARWPCCSPCLGYKPHSSLAASVLQLCLNCTHLSLCSAMACERLVPPGFDDGTIYSFILVKEAALPV